MAQEIRHFQTTCPAGTPVATPLFTSVAFPQRHVRRIDWRVPQGPMGVMGFLIAMDGVPVLPNTTFTYVVAHGETGYWEIDDYPTSGSWQVVMYNTGTKPHSVYTVWHLDLVRKVTPVPMPYLNDLLASVPDLSQAGPPVAGRL